MRSVLRRDLFIFEKEYFGNKASYRGNAWRYESVVFFVSCTRFFWISLYIFYPANIPQFLKHSCTSEQFWRKYGNFKKYGNIWKNMEIIKFLLFRKKSKTSDWLKTYLNYSIYDNYFLNREFFRTNWRIFQSAASCLKTIPPKVERMGVMLNIFSYQT